MIINLKPLLMTDEEYASLIKKEQNKVNRQLKYYENKLSKIKGGGVMKHKYLLITDNEFAQFITEADNWKKALCNYYNYYFNNPYITVADFEKIIDTKSSEEAIKLFEHLTSERVLFFGIVNKYFISHLTTVEKV